MVEESDIIKRPFQRFVADQASEVVRIKPPKGLRKRMTFFGIQDIINGQRLQFTFVWHARPFVGDREPYYMLDIYQVDGPRVRKIRLEPGVFVNVPGMFPDSAEAPDGQVAVLDLDGEGNLLTPKTIDSGEHAIVVIPGRLEVT